MITQKRKSTAVPENYKVYKPTPVEAVLSIVVLAIIGFVGVYVFYSNIYFSIVGLAAGFLGPKTYSRWRVNRREDELNREFRDFLHMLNSSICAGKSLNEAIISAKSDMLVLYMDDKAVMNRELSAMVLSLSLRTPVQEVLDEFGKRSGNEDIRSFASVMGNGLDQGIDQATLIQKTVSILTEKMEIQQEIHTKVSAIQMEQKIMAVMPVAVLLMIKLMSPEYLDPLYESPSGYLLVTLALAMLIGAFFISKKITNIKV